MNKKNTFFSGGLVVLIGAALCIPAAHAIPFALDTKIGEADLLNSADATELAKMEFFANDNNLVQDLKVDLPPLVAFENTGAFGQWYIDVGPTEPGYFLLKFGTGSTGIDEETYFFRNIGETTKLVWSDTQVQFLSGGGTVGGNIGRLSHYTTYNGETTTQVPEPATFALLGLGLAAIGATRRRNQ